MAARPAARSRRAPIELMYSTRAPIADEAHGLLDLLRLLAADLPLLLGRHGAAALRGEPAEQSRETDTALASAERARRGRGHRLVVVLEHEQLPLPPDTRERAAVNRARPVAVERGEMVHGAVALVAREAVLRKLLVRLEHQAIAGHLGHDRGGGHRRAPRVAGDEIALWARQRRPRDKVREHQIGDDGERGQRLAHG